MANLVVVNELGFPMISFSLPLALTGIPYTSLKLKSIVAGGASYSGSQYPAISILSFYFRVKKGLGDYDLMLTEESIALVLSISSLRVGLKNILLLSGLGVYPPPTPNLS